MFKGPSEWIRVRLCCTDLGPRRAKIETYVNVDADVVVDVDVVTTPTLTRPPPPPKLTKPHTILTSPPPKLTSFSPKLRSPPKYTSTSGRPQVNTPKMIYIYITPKRLIYYKTLTNGRGRGRGALTAPELPPLLLISG